MSHFVRTYMHCPVKVHAKWKKIWLSNCAHCTGYFSGLECKTHRDTLSFFLIQNIKSPLCYGNTQANTFFRGERQTKKLKTHLKYIYGSCITWQKICISVHLVLIFTQQNWWPDSLLLQWCSTLRSATCPWPVIGQW